MISKSNIDELTEFHSRRVEMVYALDASKRVIRDAVDDEEYFCFICSQMDNKKTPVAFNHNAKSFHHRMAPPHSRDIIVYYNDKEFLYQFAIADEKVSDIREGAKLSSPDMNATLYIKTRYEYGKTVVFEISNPVAKKSMSAQNLHKKYQSKKMHDQWIYSIYNSNPFFSYDYRHGVVVDAVTSRIGFIVIKADISTTVTIDNVAFANFDIKGLEHAKKYVCWTNALDWFISEEGLKPKEKSEANKVKISLENNREIMEQRRSLEKATRAERMERHKEKWLARAKARGIDPDKGHEVFIPPFEEPPYTTYPLTYGMLVEQAAYMARMSPFDYIQHIIPASNQWGAYEALRNRWEDTGKYDKSTFPDFELLRKSA